MMTIRDKNVSLLLILKKFLPKDFTMIRWNQRKLAFLDIFQLIRTQLSKNDLNLKFPHIHTYTHIHIHTHIHASHKLPSLKSTTKKKKKNQKKIESVRSTRYDLGESPKPTPSEGSSGPRRVRPVVFLCVSALVIIRRAPGAPGIALKAPRGPAPGPRPCPFSAFCPPLFFIILFFRNE